ncbi:MAG: hypothetical protein COB12_08690 [Flavobacterium sp.]|nr:MAG: hypothetical protein COB12_08690 [Flavobacterium sp.]
MSIYYYKNHKSREVLYLTWFLGITIFVETISSYSFLLDDLSFLSRLKGTNFENNYWIYNIYMIVSYLFYGSFFKWYLKSNKAIKILDILSVVYVIGSILYLIINEGFFEGYSLFTLLVGTILVLLSLFYYYYEIIKNDSLLNIKKSVPFYVSLGALFFHLFTTPVLIYSIYYRQSFNPEFDTVFKIVLYGSNLILYFSFILGFIICSKKKKI